MKLLNNNGTSKSWLKPSFRLADKIVLEALSKILNSEQMERIIFETGAKEERNRLLPARLVMILVIAMNLHGRQSLPEVLNTLVEGLRFHGAYLLDHLLPVKSAITQARQRLGVGPMVALFRALAHPIAKANEAWAFYKGLRLMALDGTSSDMPDYPDNKRFFGRPGTGKGEAAWPMARMVILLEVGTRMICDVFVGGYKTAEQPAAVRLMRSLGPGMLLLWDRNFVGYHLCKRALACGAQLLGRLRSNMIFVPIENFPDGSFSAKLYPSSWARRKNQDGILVRIIEYKITDPALPGFGEKHRLMSSLLDWQLHSAKELIVLYHERWEIEIANSEFKIQLAEKTPTLRSRTPLGCLQEIYGLLIAHIVVRSLMYEAASKYDLDPDRLSFKDSVRVIMRGITRMQAAKTETLPAHYEMMLDEIASKQNPPRQNRINPRVQKQRIKKFPSKQPDHYLSPQPQMAFHEAIYVLN